MQQKNYLSEYDPLFATKLKSLVRHVSCFRVISRPRVTPLLRNAAHPSDEGQTQTNSHRIGFCSRNDRPVRDNNNLFDVNMVTASCCRFGLPSQYPKLDKSPSGAFTSTFFDRSKAWMNAAPFTASGASNVLKLQPTNLQNLGCVPMNRKQTFVIRLFENHYSSPVQRSLIHWDDFAATRSSHNPHSKHHQTNHSPSGVSASSSRKTVQVAYKPPRAELTHHKSARPA
jgi:hypothetical protein